MTLSLDGLKVIDWEENRKLAGNREELGSDMLKMLATSLPDELATINHMHEQKKYAELFAAVHKLHGATAYCGTPRLLAVLAALEVRLKSNTYDHLPELVNQLNEEASLFSKNCAASRTG